MGRARGILRRPGTTDPAPPGYPDHRCQSYSSPRSASVVLKGFALSSPPKCGCDVTSAAKSMQVAKFTKYAGAFSVISVV